VHCSRVGVGRKRAAWPWLVTAIVLWEARALADSRPVDVSTGLEVTTAGDVPFAWPAVDAPPYADPGAVPFRRVIQRWRDGERPRGIPATPRTAAERYLAADVAFLDARAKQTDWFVAVVAYERALRAAPGFPDASRARFLRGQVYLALGLAPEAAAAFHDCARRDPAGPWTIDARIGEATALARSGHEADARSVLDGVLHVAQGSALCRAHAGATALSAVPARRAEAFARFAAACPDALRSADRVREYAEALAGAGDVDGARRVVAAVREPAGDEAEQGILHLLAGELAPDPDAARLQYEHVLGSGGSPRLALEAHMRLALLDARDDPGRLASALGALLARPVPATLRAELLGHAADASARAGRFEEALALLDRLGAFRGDPIARTDAGRARVLARWVADLDRRGDDACVATVYAAYTTELEIGASADDRLAIARALGRLGIHGVAAAVLARTPTPRPDVTAALAEESLAAGDPGRARAAAERLLADPSAVAYADRARTLRARAALAAGDVDGAAAAIAETADPGIRGEVGAALLARDDGVARASTILEPALAADGFVPVRTLLAAGSAALARGAVDVARGAYRRALDASTSASERAEAAAGLARAANDPAAALAALAQAARPDGSPEADIIARIAAVARRAAGGHGG